MMKSMLLIWTMMLAAAALVSGCGESASSARATGAATHQAMTIGSELPVDEDGKVRLSEEEWRARLTPEQYHILREKGTERAFTGAYWNSKTPGAYTCAGCGLVLFTSDTKFDSGCGWPSFYEKADPSVIEEHLDTSYGMIRTEVTCSRCGGHLGHVFDDGPRDKTGLRYCINSAAIRHTPKDAAPGGEGR